MLFRICLLLAILLVCVSMLNAQDFEKRIHQFDRNDDGEITKKEAEDAAWFDRLLKRADSNQDGKLQISELRFRDRRFGGSSQRLKEAPKAPPHQKKLDVVYRKIDGVDPNLLSLDLYIPEGETDKPRPCMIMIHGGAWRMGDKANENITAAKLPHFLKHGYIYASVNYRLSPGRRGGKGVQHPAHVQDCAHALAWLHDNIANYDGDPNQLHLIGHSAGAHLAGLLGTNERFLKQVGKDLSIIKTNVLLDTAAVNLTDYLENRGQRLYSNMYENAFGTDNANLIDASPFHHVAKGKSMPPTLLFYGGNRMSLHKFGPQFTQALTKAGSPSQAIDTVDLSHAQINFNIGLPGDEMTKLIMRLHSGEDVSKFPTVLPGKKKLGRKAG